MAMVGLTAGSDPRFETNAVELDREGLSYTVDTLGEFARQHPTADRYFLVGADVLATFAQWRDPRTVLELAALAVLTRRSESGAADAVDRTAVDAWVRDGALQAEQSRRATGVPTRRGATASL